MAGWICREMLLSCCAIDLDVYLGFAVSPSSPFALGSAASCCPELFPRCPGKGSRGPLAWLQPGHPGQTQTFRAAQHCPSREIYFPSSSSIFCGGDL